MDVILVGYSVDRTRKAFTFCDALLENVSIERRILVANSPAILSIRLPSGWELMTGSNSLGEFSAWNEGLMRLRDGASRCNGAVFLNDTIGAHRHLSRFMRHAFRKTICALASNSLVGFNDGPPPAGGPHSILGEPLRSWISTYCFAISIDVLQRLDWHLARESEVDLCVNGGGDSAGFFSAAISPAMREYLRWWLFGGGWYRSEPLSDENKEYFLLKARCICAELLLSAHCQALGVTVRDPVKLQPAAAALDRLNAKLYGIRRRHRMASTVEP